MPERLREIFEDEDAWVVGGAIRDRLLRRPVLDLDVACADPREAAHRFARRFGGAAFPLSAGHGAWRVVDGGVGETVDFTPLAGGIDADLGSRDFTFNAIAERVATGEPYDPYEGRRDLEARVVRAVSETVFCGRPPAPAPSRALRGRARLPDGRTDGGPRPCVSGPRDEARRRADPRGARQALGGGIPPARGGRAARSTRRRSRRAPRCARRPRLSARRRLRRPYRATPDLERAQALRPRSAGGASTRRRIAARDSPLPARDRALVARRARVRGHAGAAWAGGGGAARRSRGAARARRRARPGARPCDRAYPRGHRRGASSRHDHDARGGPRAS